MAGPAMICVGRIAAPHGVRGAVKIKSFTARTDDIAAYGPLSDEAGARRFAVKIVGRVQDMLIATLDGVTDRNAAERLKGLGLYVPRDRLPPAAADEFYHADLIGLAAMAPDGSPLGRVAALHNFGAGDVIEIARDGAGAALVPFTRRAVPVVDVAGGRVVVDLPDGLDAAPGKDERP
jgi:16S rRNA processing protein RimM